MADKPAPRRTLRDGSACLAGSIPARVRWLCTGWLLVAVCAVTPRILLADATLPPASWPRWLDASPANTPLADDDATGGQRLVDVAFAGSQRRARLPARAVAPVDAVAVYWNDVALALVVKYQLNPLRAARMLAHVHAAGHDALAALAQAGGEPRTQLVALHVASATVLAHFFPREPPDQLQAMAIAALMPLVTGPAGMLPPHFQHAETVARATANAAIRRALDDGADAVWEVTQRPPPTPATWRAAPPLDLYQPVEPLAGQWRRWLPTAADDLRPPPPLPYDSAAYWNEVDELLRVARMLSDAQKRIADDWNLDRGSLTPPGVWNRKAVELIRQNGLGSAEAVRVLATLNVAIADALVACWETKFTYWTVRPVNVIRERRDPRFPALSADAVVSRLCLRACYGVRRRGVGTGRVLPAACARTRRLGRRGRLVPAVWRHSLAPRERTGPAPGSLACPPRACAGAGGDACAPEGRAISPLGTIQ